MCRIWKSWERPPERPEANPEAPYFLVDKRDLKRGSRFLLMGQDIQYNNVNLPGRAAVCLGSHAARGDYGGCDFARVARLGSHAARGGRGDYGSARTMRVVIMARLT